LEAAVLVPEADDVLIREVVLDPRASTGLATFRSLHYRDFRLLWLSTLFMSAGQWIQQVTLGWLAYQMTGSAFMLGAINGVRSFPMLILGPLGGVAADRVERKRLLVGTQVVLVASAFALALVISSGQLRVWHLFVFTAVTGVAWAFMMPVRQSLVPNLVPEQHLMNALALNSAGFNATRIIGPMAAGLMIAKLGAGENFYVQTAFYVGMLWLVTMVVVPPLREAAQKDSVVYSLKEGIRYVWHHPTLRTQMALALVPMVVGLPYMSMLPVFAKQVLHHGAGGYGLMLSATGIGAVIGTLTLATLGDIKHKGILLVCAVFALGLALMAFSMSRSFPLSLGLLVFTGMFQMLYMTTNQTLLQVSIPDEVRGRVNGIYMLNQGLLPLGTLFAGAMSDIFNAPIVVFTMGVFVALLAVSFAVKAKNIREA
jgi:MFS family permease